MKKCQWVWKCRNRGREIKVRAVDVWWVDTKFILLLEWFSKIHEIKQKSEKKDKFFFLKAVRKLVFSWETYESSQQSFCSLLQFSPFCVVGFLLAVKKNETFPPLLVNEKIRSSKKSQCKRKVNKETHHLNSMRLYSWKAQRKLKKILKFENKPKQNRISFVVLSFPLVFRSGEKRKEVQFHCVFGVVWL